MQGAPTRPVHCKRCPGSQFETISDLRKHQWAAHAKQYYNFLKKGFKGKGRRKKRPSKELTVRQARELPQVKLATNGQVHLNGDMRVSDLLVELKGQQKFINDVVALISGVLKRHEEEAE